MRNLYDVIVIGGGQSGLAAGYYLQKWGATFLILEASPRAMGSWEHHYDSLRLFSPAKYSSLPGLPFDGDPDRYPNKTEVAAYLEAYQNHFKLPVLTNSPVTAVSKHRDGFSVVANGTVYRTKAVISATGGFRNPHLPQITDAHIFTGDVLHSFAYKNAELFHGKRVVVVGAGNSAIQIADELANTAVVTLATRDPIHFQKQRIWGKDIHLWLKWTGLDIFPKRQAPKHGLVIDSGRFQEALQNGKFHERQMFTSFYEGGVVWADGHKEAVDAVIFATGFRPNVDYLASLDVLDENGRIQHIKGISTTTPGLYFVGIPFQRNLASATLRGAGYDAKFVTNHLRKNVLFTNRKSQFTLGMFGKVRDLYCSTFCTPAQIPEN